MTIAELRGKISESGSNLSERMEDLLTANTFGCMRYVPPERILLPFLSTARSFHDNGFTVPNDIVAVHYAFWPYLQTREAIPCEPDVLIGIEIPTHRIHLILVETKYYSGLSSEEDERPQPNDQLAREMDNLEVVSPATLGWMPQMSIVSRTLLFVTEDMGIPRNLLAKSLDEYKRKRNREGDIYWTSWRFLLLILECSLEYKNSPEYIAVLEDMLKLLLRKGLTMFRGVESVTEYFVLPEFYQATPTTYSWPHIPESRTIDYEFEVIR